MLLCLGELLRLLDWLGLGRLLVFLSRLSLLSLAVRRFCLLPERLRLLVGDGFQAGDVVVCIIVYLETNLSIIP